MIASSSLGRRGALGIGFAWAMALPLAVLGLVGTAFAGTPGQPDPSFEAPALDERVFSVAVQPDGKILIGGDFTEIDGEGQRSLARLNADGSLDETFSPPSLFRQVETIAVQPDGKILIGGNVLSGVRDALIRLNADGSIDEGFPDPGLVRPDPGNPALWLAGYVASIALQPDGKIVIGGDFTKLGGASGEPRERVARLNSDGTIDLSFGSHVPGTGPNDTVNSVALDPDGKVLIGGDFTEIGVAERDGVARLLDDGTVDPGFGNPGVTGGSVVTSLAVQPNDNKAIIGGGFNFVDGQARFAIGRLGVDGTLDIGFSDPDVNAAVESVALQEDGRVLIGGFFDALGSPQIPMNKLARLDTDGTLDTTFVDPGITFLTVRGLALQPDGKVITVGYQLGPPATEGRAARFLSTYPQAAPTSVSATAGNGQATVSWAAVPGEITGYSVTASPGGATCDATSSTTCTVTGLTNGTSFTFTVTAGNEFGIGPDSTPSNAVTPVAPTPDPPTPDPPGPTPNPPGPTPDPPTPDPTVTVEQLRAKVTGKSVLVTSRVKASGAGKIGQRATTGKGKKTRTWCRASKAVSAAGTHSLQCNLGSKGRKALRKGALKLTLRTTFTPTVGEAVTANRKLTVKRKR